MIQNGLKSWATGTTITITSAISPATIARLHSTNIFKSVTSTAFTKRIIGSARLEITLEKNQEINQLHNMSHFLQHHMPHRLCRIVCVPPLQNFESIRM